MTIKVTTEEIVLLQELTATYKEGDCLSINHIWAIKHLLEDWQGTSRMIVDLGTKAQKVLEEWRKNGIIKTG